MDASAGKQRIKKTKRANEWKKKMKKRVNLTRECAQKLSPSPSTSNGDNE